MTRGPSLRDTAPFAILWIALLPITAPIFVLALLYGWLRKRLAERTPWWVER